MSTWKRTVGARPYVILEERADRGGQVYARWWCSSAQAWRRRATGVHLRTEAGWHVDPSQEMEAVSAGLRLHARIQAGQEAGSENGTTVREVLDAYCESETEGLSRRYNQDIRRAAGVIEEALGASTLWAQVTTAKVAEIWRGLARRSPDGRGRRWAVRVAELVWRVGAWAELQGLVGTGAGPRPPHGWRRHLARDFDRLGGEAGKEPARPRYSPEALRSLWRALERVDARLALAVLALGGGELRLGQVVRTRRSDLDLTLGSGVFGLGTAHVLGSERKLGVVLSLDAPARRAVEDALLDGHICVLEAAYRNGAIEDYPLVPGGPMIEGKIPLGPAAARPISPSTLRRLYRTWERLARVPTKPGRGWHACRRASVDAAVGLHDDHAVLARVGGWSPHSDVRARIYRARSDERVAAEAERVRARLRASFQEPHGCRRPIQAEGAPTFPIRRDSEIS